MRRRNVERVLANTPGEPLLTEASRRDVARFIAGIDEALARSFPVRRLDPGECSCHRNRRGLWVQWGPPKQWVARTGKEMITFVDRIRRDVGAGALAFRLSPTVELMSDEHPILWLSGYVIPREVARQVGTSFNREMRTGRRAWWR